MDDSLHIELEPGKKLYFASDFHLGTPNHDKSFEREKAIINWLEMAQKDAKAIFLVGDIFDFWFEYKYVVPKGYVRFLGKLASIIDQGIPVYGFWGNHDMWMFSYLQNELGVQMYKDNLQLSCNGKRLFVGHGDGYGPGDTFYKLLKKIFRSKVAQWIFARLHPNFSFWLATSWSKSNRDNHHREDETPLGEGEWLYQYSKEQESYNHHDFYIFGHRHLPLEMEVSEQSRYINLGEWIKARTYGEFDGSNFTLKTYEG